MAVRLKPACRYCEGFAHFYVMRVMEVVVVVAAAAMGVMVVQVVVMMTWDEGGGDVDGCGYD